MQIRIARHWLMALIACVLISFDLSAEFTVAKIFGDNMVLQRNEPIVIWGWGTSGEELSISFDAQTKGTTITDQGKWMVRLSPKEAGGPYTMQITGSTTTRFENILIGDVWLCSGQSNMEWRVHQTPYKEVDQDFLDMNMVRMFTVQIAWDCMPSQDIAGGQWNNLTPENIQAFSAVAYHFGKALNKDLDVPIGLVNSSLGATAIESWMSNDVLMEFEQIFLRFMKIHKVAIGSGHFLECVK